jgi:hypothetical protein
MKVYNTDYKRELVQMALSLDPEERTPDEISTLKRLTIAFNFFKNLPPDVHTELCKFMTFKTYREYGVIIKEGDVGDCMSVPFSLGCLLLFTPVLTTPPPRTPTQVRNSFRCCRGAASSGPSRKYNNPRAQFSSIDTHSPCRPLASIAISQTLIFGTHRTVHSPRKISL